MGLLLALALSSCGGPLPPPLTSTTVPVPTPTTSATYLPNIGEIQTAIARAVIERYHVAATAHCPAVVVEHPGKMFRCTALAGPRTHRERLPFEVTEVSGSYVTFKQITR